MKVHKGTTGSRLRRLWEFVESDAIEVDYGYLPLWEMNDESKVDEYIKKIREELTEWTSLNGNSDLLNPLNKI